MIKKYFNVCLTIYKSVSAAEEDFKIFRQKIEKCKKKKLKNS